MVKNKEFLKFCKSVKCPYFGDAVFKYGLYKPEYQFICMQKSDKTRYLCGFITKAGNIRKIDESNHNPRIDLKQIKSFLTTCAYLKYIKGIKNENNSQIPRISKD